METVPLDPNPYPLAVDPCPATDLPAEHMRDKVTTEPWPCDLEAGHDGPHQTLVFYLVDGERTGPHPAWTWTGVA